MGKDNREPKQGVYYNKINLINPIRAISLDITRRRPKTTSRPINFSNRNKADKMQSVKAMVNIT